MKPRVYKDPRTGHWICMHNGGRVAFAAWEGALQVALLAARSMHRRTYADPLFLPGQIPDHLFNSISGAIYRPAAERWSDRFYSGGSALG